MLVNAIEKGNYHYNLLCRNGGRATYKQLMEESDWSEWKDKLKKLPVQKTYVNTQNEVIYLSHAGFTPFAIKEDKLGVILDQDLIWSREHFWDDWPENKVFQNAIVVHGHTPTPYLLEDLGKRDCNSSIVKYCDGHKICIDAGAVFTGRCALLNLNTWEEIIFNTDPYLTY